MARPQQAWQQMKGAMAGGASKSVATRVSAPRKTSWRVASGIGARIRKSARRSMRRRGIESGVSGGASRHGAENQQAQTISQHQHQRIAASWHKQYKDGAGAQRRTHALRIAHSAWHNCCMHHRVLSPFCFAPPPLHYHCAAARASQRHLLRLSYERVCRSDIAYGAAKSGAPACAAAA